MKSPRPMIASFWALILGLLLVPKPAVAMSLALGVGQQEALTFDAMAQSVSVDHSGVVDVAKGDTKSVVVVSGKSEGTAVLTIMLDNGKTVVYSVNVSPSAHNIFSAVLTKLRRASGITVEQKGGKYIIAGQFRTRSDQLMLQNATHDFPGLIIDTTDPDVVESNAVVKAINRVLGDNDIANIQAHAYGQIVALEGSPKDDMQKALALRIARMIAPSIEDHVATDSNGAPPISIEVLFIQSHKLNAKEYGVSGPQKAFAGASATTKDGSAAGPEGIFGTSTTGFNADRMVGKFKMHWQIGPLTAFLKMQQTKDNSRVVSNPKLIARSGQKATFESGGAFYIAQTVRANDGSSTQTFTQQQTGITLSIEPRIDSIGQIDSKIKTTIVDQDQSSSAVDGAPPNLIKSNLETAVTMPNGQSILLSGLSLKRAHKTTQRVPLLADIPIIGELFKERSQSFDETEVAVIVTMTRVAPSDSRPQAAQQLLETSDNDVTFSIFD